MAITNLKKNSNIYVPYVITCVCSIITFYIMCAISKNDGLSKMPGAGELTMILSLGTNVIAIFSVIFLFYTNSFLIKRRKKELGLYNILGMEKKHIAKVLFLETIFVAGFSMIVGLLGGILFSKLMFLVLLYILQFSVSLKFTISMEALTSTSILFLAIFTLTLLANLWQVKMSNAINLLKGGELGEKEPKTKWILTLIGVATLGAGYTIAQIVESPLAAIMLFFVAVILVIIGTYMLFIAGSIAFLKILRRKKSFYYKPKNFIAVSGMIYRMKQNAVGLSNICILSTMVLVILSTTVSLYVGKDDLLRSRYPKDVIIEYSGNENDNQKIKELVEKAETQSAVSAEKEINYRETGFIANHKGNAFTNANTESFQTENAALIMIYPLEDYNRMENTNETLADNEVLIYSIGNEYNENNIIVNDHKLKIKKKLNSVHFLGDGMFESVDTYYLIAKDMDTISSIADEKDSVYLYAFDVDGSNKKIISFVEHLQNTLKEEITGYKYIDSLHQMEQQFYTIYGGFLFIGLFLGALFMMATVLIIYYKQISEGYDDHDRFKIMQKVGLSKREVKSTIRRQILMVFFLPLAGAVIHICFAFKMISKLLMVFNLTNTNLFMLCTLCTVLVFGAIYGVVYGWTAKIYYRLVQA